MARLITLQTFPDRGDGLFFCAFLQAHGFFAVAADEAIVGQNWLQALAIGGVRVQVMDCELEEIRAVLVEAGLEEPSRGDSSAPKTADVHLPFRRQPALLGHPISLATLGCVGFALVVWFFLEAIELDAGLNADPRTLWLPVTVAFFLVMDVSRWLYRFCATGIRALQQMPRRRTRGGTRQDLACPLSIGAPAIW